MKRIMSCFVSAISLLTSKSLAYQTSILHLTGRHSPSTANNKMVIPTIILGILIFILTLATIYVYVKVSKEIKKRKYQYKECENENRKKLRRR